MTLKLLDESKMKTSDIKNLSGIKHEDSTDKKDNENKKDNEDEKGLRLIGKERIANCERIKIGMLSNCAICQMLNQEIFDKCANKWK